MESPDTSSMCRSTIASNGTRRAREKQKSQSPPFTAHAKKCSPLLSKRALTHYFSFLLPGISSLSAPGPRLFTSKLVLHASRNTHVRRLRSQPEPDASRHGEISVKGVNHASFDNVLIMISQ